MTTQEINPAEVEAFAGQAVGWLNGAAITQMLSIGHHTGLLDAIAGLPPTTSAAIADAAGLNERYVREWLAAMTAGRVVDYDPVARTYTLPAHRAAVLTRAAGPNNLAMIATSIPQFGYVEDRVIECFRNGGGVPYAAYPRYHRFIAELSGSFYDSSLLDVTLKLVPGLTERLEAGIDVADIACGSGGAIALMAGAFPRSRFTGYDMSTVSLDAARADTGRRGLTNARFVEQDVAALDAPNAFDFIMIFDGIHDQAKPRTVLRNIARALRPDGVLLAVDVQASSHLEENLNHPIAPALYTVSTMYCMTVSLAQDGEGLGTMWGEQQARALFAEAGLAVRDVQHVPGDFMNSYFICTKV